MFGPGIYRRRRFWIQEYSKGNLASKKTGKLAHFNDQVCRRVFACFCVLLFGFFGLSAPIITGRPDGKGKFRKITLKSLKVGRHVSVGTQENKFTRRSLEAIHFQIGGVGEHNLVRIAKKFSYL